MSKLLTVSNSIRVVAILCAIAGSCLKGHAQADAQLQVLDSHFEGIWVGTNCDYTKTPMVTNSVRIEIKEDPKKRELRFEYTYGTKGQKGYDHLVRFMSINPAQSTVELHWKHKSSEQYQTVGLGKVLNDGYGEFTCGGIVHTGWIPREVAYRCIFHIEADRFNYSWQKSDDGVTFYKSGEWTLTREAAPVGSTLHP